MTDTSPAPQPLSSRVRRVLLEVVAKHLPPSAADLRLADVDGQTSDALSAHRADVVAQPVPHDPFAWALGAASQDAVVAFDVPDLLAPSLLAAALAALRPGGRMILLDPAGTPSKAAVTALEQAGFTRVLVETAAECPLPLGVLMRGERPHTTDDTLARVQGVAAADAEPTSLDDTRSRYIYALVRQTPDVPAWKRDPAVSVAWAALALAQDGAGPTLLAFTSLPRAVAFMQPAVLNGALHGVSKVAKFARATAHAWPFAVLLNPPPGILEGRTQTSISLDPTTAEAPDE